MLQWGQKGLEYSNPGDGPTINTVSPIPRMFLPAQGISGSYSAIFLELNEYGKEALLGVDYGSLPDFDGFVLSLGS